MACSGILRLFHYVVMVRVEQPRGNKECAAVSCLLSRMSLVKNSCAREEEGDHHILHRDDGQVSSIIHLSINHVVLMDWLNAQTNKLRNKSIGYVNIPEQSPTDWHSPQNTPIRYPHDRLGIIDPVQVAFFKLPREVS